MAMGILGETIDIHVGGVDNMFPHHENEIAQSEACSGHQFVKLWLHSEHLVVDNKKMSKSLGNFYTLRDLLQKGFTGRQVRCMLLQTHYKTQLNFTFQGLEAVKHTLQRLDDFVQRMIELEGCGSARETKAVVVPFLEKCYHDFAAALADDLNISIAFAALFDLVREINALSDEGQVNSLEAGCVLDLLRLLNAVLGILSFDRAIDAVPEDLQEALERRIEARKSKDWALADQLRDLIHSRGFIIEDTPQGARLKKGEE
jgi:cysteinyl-tRNA synthetase